MRFRNRTRSFPSPKSCEGILPKSEKCRRTKRAEGPSFTSRKNDQPLKNRHATTAHRRQSKHATAARPNRQCGTAGNTRCDTAPALCDAAQTHPAAPSSSLALRRSRHRALQHIPHRARCNTSAVAPITTQPSPFPLRRCVTALRNAALPHSVMQPPSHPQRRRYRKRRDETVAAIRSRRRNMADRIPRRSSIALAAA